MELPTSHRVPLSWLLEHGVTSQDFNSYGARRGSHDVMVRGTFANVRIKNLMVKDATGKQVEGGWTIDDTVALARELPAHGIDLLDCSSGGNSPLQQIPLGPGYQVAFAERVRRETGLPTGAVGMLTSPEQADTIISTGQADVVLLARELLRNPLWAIHAAKALRAMPRTPNQYLRAF